VTTSEILELLNGAWSIISAFLIPFLMIHLWEAGNLRKLSARRWLFDLPDGMKLAIGVLAAAIGIQITRTTIWYWRFVSSGEANFISIQRLLLAVGAFIGTVGFLCIMREITRHRFGHWPWLTALGTAATYVVGTIVTRKFL